MIRFASLGSGSAGNALLIEQGATRLMLDCGFNLKETQRRLENLGLTPEGLTGILVTHEHRDHVGGVFPLARRYGLPVWMTHGCRSALGDEVVGVDCRIIDSHQSFVVGSLEIQPFPVPHDAREPVQYLFSDGRLRLGVLTDTGWVTPHIRDVLSGCDGLVLEANHDAGLLERSAYPAFLKRRIRGRQGHLENIEAAQLLREIDTSRLQCVVAAHLSEKNNSPDLALQAFVDALSWHPDSIIVASQATGFAWQQIA